MGRTGRAGSVGTASTFSTPSERGEIRKIERALFPGVMPIVLTAAALAPPVGFVRLAYVAGLFVAFDGSLGFHGLLYPYLYDWFPPVRGLRVPARFSVIVGLSLAILAGFGMRRWLLRLSRGWSTAAFGAVVMLLAIDLGPSLELQTVWREPPSIYAALDPAKTVLAVSSVFDLLGSGAAWRLILLVFLQVVFVTMVYGPIAAYLVETFPARIRYTAMSLPYHIGNGIFGGLLPLIGLSLVARTGDIYAGLYYPVIVAGLTFVVGSIFLAETRHHRIGD